MKKFKLAAFGALLTCALVACFGLAACSSGPSDEEVIKGGISDTLDQVKKLDDATLDEMIDAASSELSGLDAMSIDYKDLFKTVFNGFDYQIDAVEVDGDAAKADLTITAKSFTDAEAKAEEITAKWIEEADDSVADMTEDQINAKVGELVMQAISETDPKDTTVKATFTKDGDEWSCDDDLISKVVDEAFYA